jgi:hypothetical protein
MGWKRIFMKAETILTELMAENERIFKQLRIKEKQLRVCKDALEFYKDKPDNEIAKDALGRIKALEIVG